ncbi:hypothetical protein RSK20926_02559 [Roseobacter sp. SK209-2-6]|uniref:hypothetical protein n=1 Tax=Roseobacter sp. SK209-2-6 TaxID=388739 RepID=UPI0000F3EF98|nr:hypothetical protein [Roseobacter sp. SK209-2-6]EBA16650.1 hypothetical protein RSK20926_02559 [Roseobacter sp. SK209-2-6]
MSADQDLNTALGTLKEKLEALKVMTDANQFLVEMLREEGDALRNMGADSARAMLRRKARAKFSPDGGIAPNAEVLALLEQSLSNGLEADVIPFPAPRRLM